MDRTPPTTDEINQSLYGTQAKKKRGGHHKKRPVEERTASDGTVCDSGEEKDYHEHLLLRFKAKEIKQLQCHPKFDLQVNDIHIAWYSPDWVFVECATGQLRVLDYKGKKKSKKTGKMLPRVNREFGMKAKLLKACFGLQVEIV